MKENVSPMKLDQNPTDGTTQLVLSYLKALDYNTFCSKCDELHLPVESIQCAEFNTSLDVVMCLQTFLSTGTWLGYLFNNSAVWGMYLQSITNERFTTPLKFVLQYGGPADLMLYLRACHRLGYEVMHDQEYDALEQFYLMAYPQIEFVRTQTDEADVFTPIVQDAIRMSGYKGTKEVSHPIAVSGEYASLNFEKSTSVKPVRSYLEAYEYIKAAPKVDVHFSLKVDGVNTKMLLKSGNIEVALSRGRAADSWDFTEAIRRVVATQGIDTSSLDGKITGESIVDVSALETLRLKYPGKDYKSPKSTAVAMLRSPQNFDVEDYRHLKFYPFEYGELSKQDAFVKLVDAGMTPPPCYVFKYSEIPLESLEEFSAWVDTNVLNPLWKYGEQHGIGSDGVVLQLLASEESDRADKYSDLNIALKFSHWTEREYKSKVVGIVVKQQRVEMSVRLEVEPVVTRDMNVATFVSVGSSAILVNDNIRVGDTIRFARKSEAINIYLGKE